MDLELLKVVVAATDKVREACNEKGTFRIDSEQAQDAFKLVAYGLVTVHKNKEDIFAALVKSNLHAIYATVPNPEELLSEEFMRALSQTMMMSLHTYDHVTQILNRKTTKEETSEAAETVKG